MSDNLKALAIIRQLGLEKDLTVRLDPPRVSSKAQTPMRDPDLVRFAYAGSREQVHQLLFLKRYPQARLYVLERHHPVMVLDPSLALRRAETRIATYSLIWPEERDFRPGAPYEIWGTLGQFTVFCEDGMMRL